MAKSRNFRTLKISEAGNRIIFDAEEFKKSMTNKMKEGQYETKVALNRELAKHICPNDPEPYEKRIKNWVYKNNAPNDIEDVKAMENFLGTTLLKEEVTPQAIAELQGSTDADGECIVKKCSCEQEREAARTVYELTADLIRMHKKLLISYSHANPSILAGDHCELPAEYPVYSDLCNQIRKHGFDLPREVLTNVLYLLEVIYGANVQLERVDDYYDMGSAIEEYEHYAGECDPGMIYWYDFASDMEEKYYQQLDDIFEQYLID